MVTYSFAVSNAAIHVSCGCCALEPAPTISLLSPEDALALLPSSEPQPARTRVSTARIARFRRIRLPRLTMLDDATSLSPESTTSHAPNRMATCP
jgi:hypothetical protein